jgi:sugar porter (SP) family MFS transporter
MDLSSDAMNLGLVKLASPRVLGWTTAAATGGFLFGYHAGVISGALLFIREDLNLGNFEQGALVSALALGAMGGGLVAGRFADALGRRRTLIVDAILFIVSTGLAVLAPSYAVLLVARVLTGFAGGMASSTVPLYVSEIAPAGARGRLVSVNYLMITLGIVSSYCVDLIFAGSEAWRAMLAVGLLPAAVLLAGMWRSPETPPWLDAHGQAEAARHVARQVTDQATADRMLDEFRRSRAKQNRQLDMRHLAGSVAGPALIIATTLAAVQQFAGINAIIAYAPRIMENTGLSASNSILFAVIIGAVNVLGALVSLRLVDSRGRRPLLLASLAGMFVALVLLGLASVLSLGAAESWLSLACILAYVFAFSTGMGPVFWLLAAEIFPPVSRAAGASAATATNWFTNFLVGLLFLPIAGAIGEGPTFWLFAAVCAFGLVFVNRFVPETKERSFGEIDAEVRSRWRGERPLTLLDARPTDR